MAAHDDAVVVEVLEFPEDLLVPTMLEFRVTPPGKDSTTWCGIVVAGVALGDPQCDILDVMNGVGPSDLFKRDVVVPGPPPSHGVTSSP